MGAAIESLFAQTYSDVRFVISDDGSGDRHSVADLLTDPRVAYHRNPKRLGLIENWRQAFSLARSAYPEAAYFAWASDHDLWHPRWLETLVSALQDRPDAVLAYPGVALFETSGEARMKHWPADAVPTTSPIERLRRAYSSFAPGYMVYGLFRSSALARCDVMRRVLLPDRLLVSEIALMGAFVSVPDVLWKRRLDERFSVPRQRASLFGPSEPWYAPSPWWLQHIVAFAWAVGVRDEPSVGRLRAVWTSALFPSFIASRAMRRIRLRKRWTRARLTVGAALGRYLQGVARTVRIHSRAGRD